MTIENDIKESLEKAFNKSIGAYSKFVTDAAIEIVMKRINKLMSDFAHITLMERKRHYAEREEYKHALEHVIECNSCNDCSGLAHSALERENKEGFEELGDWHNSYSFGVPIITKLYWEYLEELEVTPFGEWSVNSFDEWLKHHEYIVMENKA